MDKYECDQCRACCQGKLIVEADEFDLLPEPKLHTSDPRLATASFDEALADLRADIGRVLVIACGRACMFLDSENKCSIYPTRPNDCVAMGAGDEQCQFARAEAGLPPLGPISQ